MVSIIGSERAAEWKEALTTALVHLGEEMGVKDEWNAKKSKVYGKASSHLGTGIGDLKKAIFRGFHVELVVETKLIVNPKFADEDVNQLYRYLRLLDELTCHMKYGERAELGKLQAEQAPAAGILALMPGREREHWFAPSGSLATWCAHLWARSGPWTIR